MKIRYTQPSITQRELDYAADAAANGWGEHCYDYIERFESLFRKHLDVSYSIATSSCTGATHLGFAALGIGPGDEVIVGDVNWIACVAPVVHLGATPVFVDVFRESWCLDVECVERAITPRTKAILAVHLYGNLCELDALVALGHKYGIPVVEDAAEAIGSVWHGKRAGSIGKFGVFSFHGTKTVTTGEGGMFVTNDAALYARVLTLSNHGRASDQTKQFWPDAVGFKYKISNIQAAIGCAQLERVDELIAAKRRVFQFYKSALADLPVTLNPEPHGVVNGYWMPTVVVDEGIPFDRNKLMESMKASDIDGRVFFWPLTLLPMFKQSARNQPVSYSIYPRAFNLPSYHDLSSEQQQRVVDVFRQHLAEQSQGRSHVAESVVYNAKLPTEGKSQVDTGSGSQIVPIDLSTASMESQSPGRAAVRNTTGLKIAVTGASGFIGRHTVAALLARGHRVTVGGRNAEKFSDFIWRDRVTVVEGDLYAQPANWLRRVGEQDAMIDLAWSGLPNYKELFHFERNLNASYEFLKATVESGISRVLVAGTCFEYGLRSGVLSEDLPTDPRNSYALAKDTLRKFLQNFQEKQAFDFKWARLFYMYGPGQNPTSLLAQLDKAIDSGATYFDMSPGEQLRDYLPVSTVADYLVRLVEQSKIGGVINCCSGNPISVRGLVEKHLAERDAKIILRLGKFGYSSFEPMAFWGDRRKLDTALSGD